MPDITLLLDEFSRGDRAAGDSAFALLYGELRLVARARIRESGAQSQVETSSLVHDAFLRIREVEGLAFPDRKHFLAYASRAMRSIVVDRARRRLSARHGGGATHTEFDTEAVEQRSTATDDEVMRVQEGMEALAAAEPRLAQVVELRYFVGLSDAEIAVLLDVNERTVQRDWQKARIFLAAEFG